ncbi:MAG TPA: nucleoside monophosphate kinase, partial [Thermomicrobiales bacterium]|nr:nucleoside monophosphate kinase [Thermomicrobiales bacterium]
MHVILMGPQGSGKGTQAARLLPRLGLVSIATGELFRSAAKARTALGLRAKEIM